MSRVVFTVMHQCATRRFSAASLERSLRLAQQLSHFLVRRGGLEGLRRATGLAAPVIATQNLLPEPLVASRLDSSAVSFWQWQVQRTASTCSKTSSLCSGESIPTSRWTARQRASGLPSCRFALPGNLHRSSRGGSPGICRNRASRLRS